MVVYGAAEVIDADPERAELSADVLAAVRGSERPDPTSIIDWLDADERRVLRITPQKALIHKERRLGRVLFEPMRPLFAHPRAMSIRAGGLVECRIQMRKDRVDTTHASVAVDERWNRLHARL